MKTLVENASTGRYLATGHLVFYRGGTMFAAPMALSRLELTGPASPLFEGVAHDYWRGADFDVSASGIAVYRSIPAPARRALMWMEASGVGDRILAKAGVYTSPRLSPDGMRLALTSDSESRQAVWIYDLTRGTMRRLTFGSETECCPIWSPDGEYVMFSSGSTLAWAKWDGSGTVERLPVADGTSAIPWSFSPDGKWVAFHRNEPKTGYDLWIAPADTAGGTLRLQAPEPLLRQPGIQAAPAISPDGRWIAYASEIVLQMFCKQIWVMMFQSH